MTAKEAAKVSKEKVATFGRWCGKESAILVTVGGILFAMASQAFGEHLPEKFDVYGFIAAMAGIVAKLSESKARKASGEIKQVVVDVRQEVGQAVTSQLVGFKASLDEIAQLQKTAHEECVAEHRTAAQRGQHQINQIAEAVKSLKPDWSFLGGDLHVINEPGKT